MTIAELIDRLRMLDQSSEVLIFDPDAKAMEPVTGYVYDDAGRTVELQTDSAE